jgi:alpha-methylacyl-CoA racemase
MLNKKLIIDFSHRLPGPLAGKILADLGFEVVKLEDEQHKDPFLAGFFSSFDTTFEIWYAELNKKKKIHRFDFKQESAKKIIEEYLTRASGLILSVGDKLATRLGLTDEELKAKYPHLAVVKLEASNTRFKNMHDLNAMAMTEVFHLYLENETKDIVDPPFLPFAGIGFGQQVATTLLSGIIKSGISGECEIQTSYLFESINEIYKCFWPESLQSMKKTKFLHNGAYPCYSIYKTRDGAYAVVAAVEEKFWIDLSTLYSIQLPAEKRFDTHAESFNKVSQVFLSMTSHEIEAKLGGKDLCLSIVRPMA